MAGELVRARCEHLFVAHADHLQAEAREWRIQRGMKIDEIGERLALPRTTVYGWVRDLPIARDPERSRAAALAAGRANGERARQKREEGYRAGLEEFAALSVDPSFGDFVCMYIGEGYRRDRNRVALAKSDPVVVSLAARWIGRTTRRKLDRAVQYHTDQDPAWLKQFWAFRLGVDPAAIREQRKSNSGNLTGRGWRSKYGVLTVGTNDTMLRARLQAWIDLVKLRWSGSYTELIGA